MKVNVRRQDDTAGDRKKEWCRPAVRTLAINRKTEHLSREEQEPKMMTEIRRHHECGHLLCAHVSGLHVDYARRVICRSPKVSANAPRGQGITLPVEAAETLSRARPRAQPYAQAGIVGLFGMWSGTCQQQRPSPRIADSGLHQSGKCPKWSN
jgi:hypothetical protein